MATLSFQCSIRAEAWVNQSLNHISGASELCVILVRLFPVLNLPTNKIVVRSKVIVNVSWKVDREAMEGDI